MSNQTYYTKKEIVAYLKEIALETIGENICGEYCKELSCEEKVGRIEGIFELLYAVDEDAMAEDPKCDTDLEEAAHD